MSEPQNPGEPEFEAASVTPDQQRIATARLATNLLDPGRALSELGAARRSWLALQAFASQPGDRFRRGIARELDHRTVFNWIPVGLALGILWYFALPYEPSLMWLVGLCLILLGLTWWLKRIYGGFLIYAAASTIAGGAVLATLQTTGTKFSMLDTEIRTELTGVVVDMEERNERIRLRLTDVELSPQTELDPGSGKPGGDVLISVRNTQLEEVRLGERISARATLQPFSPPLVPGGYDFRRNAFFDGLWARGFATGSVVPELFADTDRSLTAQMAQHVQTLRRMISERIQASLPGESGALAAALLVGDRSGIAEETQNALRASGLAHILAISGLHMALVTATLFGSIRLVAAFFPAGSATWPVKKIAALAALLGAATYLGLSGGAISAQRAFIMAAVFLIAILFDRSALTMRNVAIAAIIILLLKPSAVLGPGFQMSFMAVLALVAVYQRGGPYGRLRRRLQERRGPLMTGGLAVCGLMLTSLVAGAATWPFSIHHFYQAASYGVVGNLVAMPIVALMVMPMGVLALLLLPFGLEGIPLAVMGFGIDAVVMAAEWVAGFSGALHRPGQIPGVATVLAALTLIVLCLGQTRLRFGLAALLICSALLFGLSQSQKPLLLIDGRARLLAVYQGQALSFYGNSRDQFLSRIWLGAVGDGAKPDDALTKARRNPNCDRQGCLLSVSLQNDTTMTIALVNTEEGLFETCLGMPDVIVTRLEDVSACQTGAVTPMLITRDRLRETGSLALYEQSHSSNAISSTSENEHEILTRLGLTLRRARPALQRPWH